MTNPKLRFRFRSADGALFEDWKSVKVGDIAETCGGGTPTTGNLSYWDGSIQWLTPTEINSKYVHASERTLTLQGLKNSSAKLLPKGAIVLTTRATLGACSINNFEGDVCTNQGFQSLIGKPSVDSEFLYYIVTSQRFQRELKKKASGSTFLEVSPSNLKKISVAIPSKQEQCRVADFFSALDEKITLAERKLSALQKLKSGLMQKIFSQEIRFKQQDGTDFGEWKKLNFFEVVDSLNDCRGRPIAKYGREWLTEKTEYLALSALNVKEYGIDYSVEPHYGDKELYEKWMAGRELHQGQVLLTTEAPAGVVMQIPDNKKYILNQRVVALNANFKVVTEDFLAFLLRSPEVQRDIRKLSSGGTAIGVSQKSLRGLFVQVPVSKEEQSQIAAVLSAVSEQLCLASKKVDWLKQQKQAFMQQMFV